MPTLTPTPTPTTSATSQPQPQPQPQPLIWINGFPGTGKLTIASIMQTSRESVILMHNHMLIDPVEAKFPRNHPEYQKERKLYRQKVFEEVVCDEGNLGRAVVFTDYQSSNPLGRSTATEYLTAAQRSNRPFFPIYLTCSLSANIQRLTSHSRSRAESGSSNNKLTDVDLLKSFRESFELFRFEGGDCEGEGCEGLEVDTTDMLPEEVVGRIWEFVNREEGKDKDGEEDGGDPSAVGASMSTAQVEGEAKDKI